MWAAIIIDSKGPRLTGEQLAVLERVAARSLHEGRDGSALQFEHDLCDGIVNRGEDGSYVGFVGTNFHAYLGTNGNQPWTCDFMLLRNMDKLVIDDDTLVTWYQRTKSGKIREKNIDPYVALSVKVRPVTKN